MSGCSQFSSYSLAQGYVFVNVVGRGPGNGNGLIWVIHPTTLMGATLPSGLLPKIRFSSLTTALPSEAETKKTARASVQQPTEQKRRRSPRQQHFFFSAIDGLAIFFDASALITLPPTGSSSMMRWLPKAIVGNRICPVVQVSLLRGHVQFDRVTNLLSRHP